MWAIALSVFATFVSSISFLALPEGAFGPEGWRGWVNSITVPIATVVAAIWFVPFYRRSTSVSAYSFLEERFGVWARIYASACFLVMQSMRSGVILLLLAILINQLLGFSCETIIAVTGVATLLYSMLGGFSAVVWADAVQSLVLIGGTVVCIVCLLVGIPDLSGHFSAAFAAGKMSLGSLTLADWSTNTFWVLFSFSICINLQNLGIDQCYTQRYIAAKDERSARRSIFASAWLYLGVTLLFTMIGTLLWMYDRANPGVIPEGMRAAAVFPWFIIHRLPTGVSGLLVSAIIAAAMSTIAATLNSGSAVLLEDYWKRFAQRHAPRGRARRQGRRREERRVLVDDPERLLGRHARVVRNRGVCPSGTAFARADGGHRRFSVDALGDRRAEGDSSSDQVASESFNRRDDAVHRRHRLCRRPFRTGNHEKT